MKGDSGDLRVQLISGFLRDGGAGIAAARIQEGLMLEGCKVTSFSLDTLATKTASGFRNRFSAKVNREWENRYWRPRSGLNGKGYSSSLRLPLPIIPPATGKKFDLVHLHWVNSGFFDVRSVARLCRIPVVWTLHSFWPFLGPLHYPFESTESSQALNSSRVPDDLKDVASRIHFTVPSPHMMSDLPPGLQVANIPNPLPARLRPVTSDSRGSHMMFVAAGDVFDPRKGLESLLEAWLGSADLSRRLRLLIVGPVWAETANPVLMRLAQTSGVEFLGAVGSAATLGFLYESAVGTLVPSFNETFCQVISESLAHGAPVAIRPDLPSAAAFTSVSDFIFKSHFSSSELEAFVDFAEARRASRCAIATATRAEFGHDTVARRFLEIYGEALGQSRS